ncbi:MAG: hypothetical protein IID15_01515 [Candidatus Marinimicrobia bacterium]|nr:hypothetical protein [Candidatus Neomarinimicrobiota bacterium]
MTTANPADENLRIIDLWLPAPADKPPPQSEHFIAGIEYLGENNLLFKAEVYLKSFSNLIYLKQGFIFFLGPDADQAPDDVLSEFLPAEAKARGLELLIRKNGGKVKGWLGYTFSQALWKSDEFDWYAPKYDRTHTLNLVADWQLNQRWHFSTAYSLSSGNPYTPLLGRLSNQGNSWLQPPSRYRYWSESRLLSGEKHAARYPFYGRWDVSFVNRKANSRGGQPGVLYPDHERAEPGQCFPVLLPGKICRR